MPIKTSWKTKLLTLQFVSMVCATNNGRSIGNLFMRRSPGPSLIIFHIRQCACGRTCLVQVGCPWHHLFRNAMSTWLTGVVLAANVWAMLNFTGTLPPFFQKTVALYLQWTWVLSSVFSCQRQAIVSNPPPSLPPSLPSLLLSFYFSLSLPSILPSSLPEVSCVVAKMCTCDAMHY